jgi:hypothetical protein
LFRIEKLPKLIIDAENITSLKSDADYLRDRLVNEGDDGQQLSDVNPDYPDKTRTQANEDAINSLKEAKTEYKILSNKIANDFNYHKYTLILGVLFIAFARGGAAVVPFVPWFQSI